MKLTLTLTISTLMLAGSMAACGNDQPAVCTSVDTFKASVQKVKDVDLSSSTGLSDLQSSLQAVGSDLATVKTDAKSQFDQQIGTVEASYDTVKSSVDAAKATPSAATLSAAGTAAKTFGSDAQALVSDVQSTC